MKKINLKWLAILFVAVLSVGFVSCGDDDDDDKSPLVGTWKAVINKWDGAYNIVTFRANGTGELSQTWPPSYYNMKSSFTYSVKGGGSTLNITLVWTSGQYSGQVSNYSCPFTGSTLSNFIDRGDYVKQ